MLLSPLNKGSLCPGLYLYFKPLSHPPPRAGTIHMLLWKRASQGFLLRFGSSAKGSLHKGSTQWRGCDSHYLSALDTGFTSKMVSFLVFTICACICERESTVCESESVCVCVQLGHINHLKSSFV